MKLNRLSARSLPNNTWVSPDEVGGMMLHGADGVQTHVDGGVSPALDAQHALVKGDFHPV